MSFYFYFGGKNWKYGYAPSAIALFVTLILTFFMPESPKFLYAKRNWSKLHQALSRIAWINGKDTFVIQNNFELNIVNRSQNSNDDLNLQDQDNTNKNENYSVFNSLRDRIVFMNLVAMVI